MSYESSLGALTTHPQVQKSSSTLVGLTNPKVQKSTTACEPQASL